MAPLCYRRHRFPPEIIQHAIWLYLRFTLSYRDFEDRLAERAFDISSETVRRWALKFGPRRLDSRAALRLTRKLLKKQGFAPKIAGHRQAALLGRGFPFGNLLETNGHGAWEPTERNTFEAFRFLLQKDSD